MAWWYVDKLRLDNAAELSLLSSVGNIYDLPRLQEAAIIQDRMNRRIWENHKKPDFKDKKPGGHQAYIAGVDEVTDDEEAFDGDDFDSEEHEIDENDDEKTHEAFVAYQNAKAKYNNIMKARGTSMGQSKEDRLRIAKSRSFCSVCHKKGHWHKDPECPMNKDKNQVAHTTHVVFFTDGASAGLKAIVDCACSRTLAGTRWMREYLRESRRMGIPYFIIDQNEVFKFGGPKLFPSKKAAVCWFCLEGRWWILKISVVAVDVPLLISRPALADLAMNYDIKENKASFGALGLPEVTLGFTQTGHPCLDVDHLSRPAPSWPEEVDWSTTEIFVPNYQHNTGEETVARNSGAYMASSLDRGWHKLFYPKVENHVEELMLLGDLSAETFLHWWHQQRDTDRDFWVESADVLIRVHVAPRRTFFDPRTWRTKDNTLKTQMLEALGDQRTTTCVPCTNSIRVLKIEHEWRTSHGARADFLWVGRSIFKRQARKLSPTTQLNSFDELDRPNLAMEDEQGSVDGGVGGARSGGAERVDRGRAEVYVAGAEGADGLHQVQASGIEPPPIGPTQGEVCPGGFGTPREGQPRAFDEDAQGQCGTVRRGDGAIREVQEPQVQRGAGELLGVGYGGSEGQREPQSRSGSVGSLGTGTSSSPWSWIFSWGSRDQCGDPTPTSEGVAKEDSASAEDQGNRGGTSVNGLVGSGQCSNDGGPDQGDGREVEAHEVGPRAGEESGRGQSCGSPVAEGVSKTKLKKKAYWKRVKLLQDWKKDKLLARRAREPEEGGEDVEMALEGEIDYNDVLAVNAVGEVAEDFVTDYDLEYEEDSEEDEILREFCRVNLKYLSDYEAVRNLPAKRMKRSSKKRVSSMAKRVLSCLMTTVTALATPVINEVYDTVSGPLNDLCVIATGHRETDTPALLELFAGSAHLTSAFARAGFNVLEPRDLVLGHDLRDPAQQQAVKNDIKNWRPKLLWVGTSLHGVGTMAEAELCSQETGTPEASDACQEAHQVCCRMCLDAVGARRGYRL